MWRKQLLLNVPKEAAAHACILRVRQYTVNTKQQHLDMAQGVAT